MNLPAALHHWLNAEPLESEVAIINDFAQVIPVHIVKKNLDHFTERGYWETRNFKVNYIVINGNEAIDASLELTITTVGFDGELFSRTLTGACTYTLQYIRDIDGVTGRYGVANEHYSATALSLCIVNAAKNLGAKFGANLNIVAPKLEEGYSEKPIQVNDFTNTNFMQVVLTSAKSFKTITAAMKYLSVTEFRDNKEMILYCRLK